MTDSAACGGWQNYHMMGEYMHIADLFLNNFIKMFCFGFEIRTAVAVKSSVFWDVMPCNPVKVSQCFRGTFHHHL
jgi:hypothetical protein